MAWTNSNLHDPGITVLELLSYSLVGYGVGRLLASPLRRAACGWPCVAMVSAVTVAGVIRLAGQSGRRRCAARHDYKNRVRGKGKLERLK